jgi:hypothetical protein
MSRDTTLEALQQWMLKAITEPVGVAADGIDEAILPSRQQSAGERLGVYRNAYFARLLEVLRELFPCTRFAVGDELFDAFAVAYLRRYPPHSYTLGRLADKLVEYLDETRPADWGAFVVELVRLEQAIDRIFDSAGPEGLPPFQFPADAVGSIRLNLVPGFELFAFSFPVSTYFTDWKAGSSPTWPAAVNQFVALYRRDYIVRRVEVTEAQFKLLSCLHEGLTLDEAIGAAFDSGQPPTAENVRSWFAEWAARRFFAAAE